MSRNTTQKLALFAGCFSGLSNAYGTYNPINGEVRTAKNPVTPDVMLAHLQGRQPYGVFLLTGHVTRAVVADFDQEDREPILAFCTVANRHGIAAYIERSKRRGWHAWIFFPTQGVSAHKARSVVTMILTDIRLPKTEVFPRQDRLAGPGSYGNFINAPLFGKLVPQGRTVFVDPEADFHPYADQWEFLAGIQRVTESQLDDIIDRNNWGVAEGSTKPLAEMRAAEPIFKTFGLPPCAQRMLREGVTDNQRLSCFCLARHFKKAGLTEDSACAALHPWAKKNRPTGYKSIISSKEITAQTHDAYTKDYPGCGCNDPVVAAFCSETCPLYSRVRLNVPATPSPPSKSPTTSTPPQSAAPVPIQSSLPDAKIQCAETTCLPEG